MLRITERIAFADVGIEHAMQEHIHLADRPGIQIHLLTVEREIGGVFTMGDKVITRLHQHTARTHSRVIDTHTGMRLQ